MLSLVKARLKQAVPRDRWERVRMRWWQLQRAAAIDHSALWLPWFARPASPDIEFLHRLAMAVDWQYAPGLEARIALWMTSVLWPLVSCRLVLQEVRRNAPLVVQSHQIPVIRQCLQIWYYANRRNVPPSSYYRCRLFDQANARCADRWIHHYEICNLLPELNRGRDAQVLGEKDQFYEEATTRGLPVAPVVATFQDGRIDRWLGPPDRSLPQTDLVLKPVDLSSGTRFERWTYANGRWSNGPLVLDAGELVALCERRSEERRHILQERIFNHPELAPLAGNGLCTVRLVTYRRLDTPAAPLMAAFRMPTGDGMVDNFNAGGIAAPVDLATGEMGRAVARHLTGGAFDVHPTSGAPITGVRLPKWSDALALGLRAHDAFPRMPFVGWDVVITAGKPLLLEANPTWSVELCQLPHGKPLGDTAFTPVYLEHYQAGRREAGSGAGASRHAG